MCLGGLRQGNELMAGKQILPLTPKGKGRFSNPSSSSHSQMSEPRVLGAAFIASAAIPEETHSLGDKRGEGSDVLCSFLFAFHHLPFPSLPQPICLAVETFPRLMVAGEGKLLVPGGWVTGSGSEGVFAYRRRWWSVVLGQKAARVSLLSARQGFPARTMFAHSFYSLAGLGGGSGGSGGGKWPFRWLAWT